MAEVYDLNNMPNDATLCKKLKYDMLEVSKCKASKAKYTIAMQSQACMIKTTQIRPRAC